MKLDNMLELLKKSLPYIGVAAAGLLIGRFLLQPPIKVETKEVIKYVERVEEKKEEKKEKNVVIVRKVNKDGSSETRTEISEKQEAQSEIKKEVASETTRSKVVTKGSKVSLGMLGIKDLSHPSDKLEYGLTATVPIYGPVKLQGLGTTDKRVGLGVAIEF